MAMQRIALYLRSSKDRSDVSIDAQRRELQALAESRGWVVVAEYSDAVESGKDEDRPGFQRLLRDLKSPQRTWSQILVLDTSRLSRKRLHAIIFEEQECRRYGVKVVYKSLPDADPTTEMLLKSILQAMDEWHSMNSKTKGLNGMAENIRQGYRAGGSAPMGYRLMTMETGAIRDGAPVTKTKLAPSDKAPQVGMYLQLRAKGERRKTATQRSGLTASATTLLGIERNALTYAGHTVWNRHTEHDSTGYIRQRKFRPQAEWIIQRKTHEALISDEEAQAILDQVDKRKHSGGRPAQHIYLLSGILYSPDGEKWHGVSGAYRLGKGVRISAQQVDKAVLGKLRAYLSSPQLVSKIIEHYHAIAKTLEDDGTTKITAAKLRDIERKIDRLTDTLAQTTTPRPILSKIEALEQEREVLRQRITEDEYSRKSMRNLRAIKPADVRSFFDTMLQNLESTTLESLKEGLQRLIERVELSPTTLEAVITYRFAPDVSFRKTGEQFASPWGRHLFPAYSATETVAVKRLRRNC
jgi:DNA invertase Pin-like site-specific DNA recombinase/flagellar biosynthesis chaperone FliJ